MRIFVLSVQHRHGTDVTLHPSQEDAYSTLVGYCRDWWTEEGIPGAPPEDPDLLVQGYFDGTMSEGWEIEEHEVGWAVPSGPPPAATEA